jgi:hypothetical protein
VKENYEKTTCDYSKKWLDWDAGMTVTTESDEDGALFTVLTLTIDQAALQNLLRHLYSLGIPFLSNLF